MGKVNRRRVITKDEDLRQLKAGILLHMTIDILTFVWLFTTLTTTQ